MLSYSEYRKKIEKQYGIDNRHKKIVERFIGERELWIWGASEKSDWLANVFDNIKGYIDKDERKTVYNGKTVIRPDEINSNEMYIYIALEEKYIEVEDLLKKNEMDEYADYLYAGRSNIWVSSCDNGYVDVYGNEIKGRFNGPTVKFCKGVGSVLKIGTNCNIDPSVVFHMENNSIIVIDDNVVIEKDVIIDARNGGLIHISRGGYIYHSVIVNSYRNSYLEVGENNKICAFGIVNVAQGAKVILGDDVAFGTHCNIQACDGHQFYDLETHKSICAEKSYEIEIGNHVWVGRNCTILYGAKIGSGSMVGIDSMVKSNSPVNSILAGRPAKVVRENIVWEWPGVAREDNYEELSVYDYRT